MNKRLLIGLAGAGIVGGATFGFAATLGVDSDNLGAGGDAVESCDSAIAASYTAAYTTTGYRVATVELSDIDAGCAGEGFQITLSDTANNALANGSLSGTLTGSATQSVAVSGNVAASAVEGIDVVVSGDNP